MMPPVPVLLFLLLLVAVNGAFGYEEFTQEELFSQIGNQHILKERLAAPLLNVPKGKIIIEYLPKDCRAAQLRGHSHNGLYVIAPRNGPPLIVYCDFLTDGGGWTVLQKNRNEKSFGWSLPWDVYKYGFGNPMGAHRVGNEFIYSLTKQNGYSVRFSIEDSKGITHHADYHSFRVDSEREGYALRLGNYSGNAGDALTVMNEDGVHDNMKFTTKDWDNDRWKNNCADKHEGGWWYDNCQSALLSSNKGIYWAGLCDTGNPCQSATIMIRPNRKNCEAGQFPPGIENFPHLIPS